MFLLTNELVVARITNRSFKVILRLKHSARVIASFLLTMITLQNGLASPIFFNKPTALLMELMVSSNRNEN